MQNSVDNSDDEFTNTDLSDRHPESIDSQKVESRPEAEQFTRMLCNAPPSKRAAQLTIFFGFFVLGSLNAYRSAVVLDLQEKGASMADQVTFSLSGYPFLFKIIFAPFVDLYFIRRVGKCKTWIASSTVAIGALLFAIAPSADSLTSPHTVEALTKIWFCINLLAVITSIACEMLIVKIFEADDKSKGTMLLELGMSIGGFLSYNLFVPLNSVAWLNAYVFTQHPVTKPLLTHSSMMVFVAAVSLAYGVAIFLFLGEKVSENQATQPSFSVLFRRLGRFFTRIPMRNLLIFISLTRIFRFFVNEAIGLKFIDNGVSKTTLVNIDTATFPLYLVVSVYLMRFLVKGKIMRWFSWMMVYAIFLTFTPFFILKDLEANKNLSRTTWLLMLLGILRQFCSETPFLLGFINLITPEEIGSTFITFLACWLNLNYSIPTTLGLQFVHENYISFDLLVICCLSLQLAIIFYYKPYCYFLDLSTKEDFSLEDEPATPDPAGSCKLSSLPKIGET